MMDGEMMDGGMDGGRRKRQSPSGGDDVISAGTGKGSPTHTHARTHAHTRARPDAHTRSDCFVTALHLLNTAVQFLIVSAPFNAIHGRLLGSFRREMEDMEVFLSTNIGRILGFALVFLCISVLAQPADVKCENVYKDFSDCVLELGESMDNYKENVTSETGVAAVCSHWEAFHTCALTALSDCRQEVSAIWETLRQDARKMHFQGNLFNLCSPSSSPNIAAPVAALTLPLTAMLLTTGPRWCLM
ncbi:neuritin-like [Nerophis lumbriciformis]|uniref:neuritin-like n=1 Tax=Nerophis lumbriciformis TaxID=546530 RepID=UPI003BAAAC33